MHDIWTISDISSAVNRIILRNMAKAFFFVLMMTLTSFSVACHAQVSDASVNLLKNCKFNKIFQFGDSLSDTGNIAIEVPNIISAKLPYGFMSNFSKPTGRCSNGLLMIDYVGINLMFKCIFFDFKLI